MKKSRHLYLHPETNPGKITALEALHAEYVAYVRICVQTMLDNQRLNLKRSEKQAFFPKAENLTSQIQKNARDHAIQIVSTWAKATYERALKKQITRLHRFGEISQDERHALCTVGKHLISAPWKQGSSTPTGFSRSIPRFPGTRHECRIGFRCGTVPQDSNLTRLYRQAGGLLPEYLPRGEAGTASNPMLTFE